MRQTAGVLPELVLADISTKWRHNLKRINTARQRIWMWIWDGHGYAYGDGYGYVDINIYKSEVVPRCLHRCGCGDCRQASGGSTSIIFIKIANSSCSAADKDSNRRRVSEREIL